MVKTENEKLYIPYGIEIEKEYIEGFTKKEIKHFIFGTLCAGAAALISFLILQSPMIPIMLLMTGTGGCYCITKKSLYSQSAVETIGTMLRFRRSQQKFSYIYRYDD